MSEYKISKARLAEIIKEEYVQLLSEEDHPQLLGEEITLADVRRVIREELTRK
tara:strand:- start:514 stop:672 length:159 start_codon:yes stop_codon:yes gene_type:complete